MSFSRDKEQRDPESPADRRSGWSLRPRIRFPRSLIYAIVVAVAIVAVVGWIKEILGNARVRELERVVQAQTDSLDVLRGEVARQDTVRLAIRDTAQAYRDSVFTLRLEFTNRPVRIIRLPGRVDTLPVTAAVIGNDTIPVAPEIAETIERCTMLLMTCGELARTTAVQAKADSIGIAQRDSVIVFQDIRFDSTMVLVDELKKRHRNPFTVVLGIGATYNVAPCSGPTVVVDGRVFASQSCSTLAYGPGITAGLDLVWTVDKLLAIARIF